VRQGLTSRARRRDSSRSKRDRHWPRLSQIAELCRPRLRSAIGTNPYEPVAQPRLSGALWSLSRPAAIRDPASDSGDESARATVGARETRCGRQCPRRIDAASHALGRADLSTSLGVYGHFDGADLREAMQLHADWITQHDARKPEVFPP
jgi:hypothetical protein